MPRKKKLPQQIHGNDELQKREARTIDELLGGKKSYTKFGTLDKKEYEARLNKMNLVDLQAEATKQRLLPHSDRRQLIARLLKDFDRHYISYGASSPKPPKKNKSFDQLSEASKTLLRQGR